MWKLVIEDDENKRTSVPLLRDSYVVGRREGSTVRLTERNISREHCRITRRSDGTGYTLEDASSYNGVYVNGIRIDGVQELVHGDLVQIGDYRIILQDDAVGDAMVPVEAPSTNSAKTTQPLSTTARAASLLERPHRLVVLVGPTPGAEFSLEQPRLTVGRAEDCTLSVNHNSVSRLHCEIHDLGEGRFEIVDKGSANGVRVNGADLRRGIIEAGDLIELGDVRFKFIGRGQVFVPGAGDSQQLTAIADRLLSGPPEGRRAPLLVLLIFCIVLAGAVVIGLLLRARAARLAGLPEVAAPDTPELRLLTEIKLACDVGDCEAARARLKFSDNSALRGSPMHRQIENRWAELQFKRVEQEPDVSRARELVEQVERNTLVSEPLRRRANEWIAALDTSPTTSPTTSPDTAPDPLPSAGPAGAQSPPDH
jgi:pSer/pThr/pTyr-binding forkhead associated (FHA) protein